MRTYRFCEKLDGQLRYVKGESYTTWYDALVCGRASALDLVAMVVWAEGIYKREHGMFLHREERIIASADATDALRAFAQDCAERARMMGGDPEVRCRRGIPYPAPERTSDWGLARKAPMEARLTRVASKLRDAVKEELACDDLGLGSLDALSWLIQDGCEDSDFLKQTGLRQAMVSVATHVRDVIWEREACWQAERLDWQMGELFRTVFAEEEADA